MRVEHGRGNRTYHSTVAMARHFLDLSIDGGANCHPAGVELWLHGSTDGDRLAASFVRARCHKSQIQCLELQFLSEELRDPGFCRKTEAWPGRHSMQSL